MKNNITSFEKTLLVCLLVVFIPMSLGAVSFVKPRILVTTDITNEPDDQESLIRLLAYANDYDIEGLIGSTGVWKVSDPATFVIHDCIDAYAKVHEQLLKHDEGFPAADYLHDITTTGNWALGMSAVNERGSDGSRLIIQAVDNDDERPVWLLIWGGANTVAQALWTVQQTRSDAEIEKFIQKVRVIDLAAQDDAGAWIAHTFPEIFMIRNVLTYKGMSYRFSSNAWDHTRGGDESVVTPQWVKENIQTGHGALGAAYPDALHLYEGDTPTYFYLMPNGLNDPEQQWQGSWGGRFSREKQKNMNIIIREYGGNDCPTGCWVNELPYKDYYMYADAKDHFTYGDTTYYNQYASIFRWRTDFQNDFAARMDWCVKEYDEANHNPIVVINDNKSRDVIYKEVKPGERITLNASKSSDPDKDKLNFNWWNYQDAGTYDKEVKIHKNTSAKIKFKIPSDIGDKTIHVILTVRDHGAPPLTSYRRVVLKGIEP